FWHRWIGIGVASIAALALVLRAVDKASPRDGVLRVYRGAYLMAAMLVGVSGYLGGEMVFGSNHILEVFATPEDDDDTLADDMDLLDESEDSLMNGAPVDEAAAQLFVARIHPVLEESCFHCHGPRRQKASLRLDRPQGLKTVVVPGDAAESVLFERISLPLDHPDLMPPDDDRLPEDVVQAFRQWIDGGAPWVESAPVVLHLPGPGAADEVAGPEVPGGADEVDEAAEMEARAAAWRAERIAELDRQLDALRGQNIRVVRLGPESLDVAANLSLLGERATNETLALLAPLGERLVRLDIGGTAITDDGLTSLPAYPRLVRLQIQKTAITDSGFRVLARMHQIEDLDCSETAITDASIPVLRGMPALRRVRLWKTNVTAAGVETLRRDRADLDVTVEAP
ncbi:MAG: hypothetical protein KDA21_14240, partial [Phycisphaerales bacterium]|nr:hypothetical protein [Phycisphaerales bacterium]